MSLRGVSFRLSAPWVLLALGLAAAATICHWTDSRVETATDAPALKPSEPRRLPPPPPRRVERWTAAAGSSLPAAVVHAKPPLELPPAMAKRLLTAQLEADEGPIADVQAAGFFEVTGAQVAEPTAVAPVEEAADLASPLEGIITEFESQSREHHTAIRLSRYDFEISRAGAELFSPVTIGARGPTVEPSDGAAWATASVEPDVEVAAIVSVAVDAESLDHLRRPAGGNAWILSPPPVEPARVEPTPVEPTRVELASHQTPSMSTEVAIRPASERSVEPPPRLLIVAEPIDAPTLRLRSAVPH